MELWMRLLVAFLAVTISTQRSIRESELVPTYDDDGIYRANYDEFPDEANVQDSNCSCDWRYLRHYEAKGCSPVEEDSCGCPTKFDCPNVNEIEEDSSVCIYRGTKYPSGARINTTNPCERCRCSRGPIPEITCYPVECPEFENRLPDNCHYVYTKNHCCPVRSVCVEDDGDLLLSASRNSSATCEYNGRIYPLGARMYSDDDPCAICPCTEDWQGSNDPRCYQVECNLEKKRSKLLEGCVPIYEENACCPVDFYCAADDEFISEANAEADSDSDYGSLRDIGCMLGGKFYKVGETVNPVKMPSRCVTCSCQVPPDVTCMQQRCTPNPNEKFCSPYYSSDGCCPSYECMFGEEPIPSNVTFARLEERVNRELEDDGSEASSSDSDGTCFETQCSGDMTCLLYQVNCGNSTCSPVPTCLKTNSSCPTPKCAPGCVVIEQNEYKCLTCACGEDIQKHVGNLKCNMPQCAGRNCHLVGGSDGCPTCSCVDECQPLQCQPGCNVVSEREGACPTCVCEDETEGCPTPVCEHEGCRIENSTNGCPTCICDRGRSFTSGREIEPQRRPKTNFQQQQQQQQQQMPNMNGKSEMEEGAPPSAEDYGDDILLMSGSSAGQSEGKKANVRARSLDEAGRTLGNRNDEGVLKSGWHIMDDGESNPEFRSYESPEEYEPEYSLENSNIWEL